MVAVSIDSCRSRTGARAIRSSSAARVSGVQARLVVTSTSDAIVERASRMRPPRTLWMIDRSVTMAATPMATQMKKNSRRRQDARSSRAAIRKTKSMVLKF